MKSLENIRKYGNELEEVKSEIQTYESIIEKITDDASYNAVCEIKMTGMYSRLSKRIYLTTGEVNGIISDRVANLYAKRDFLIRKLNSLV